MVLRCRDWITWSPIEIFGQHIGIFRLLVAFSFISTMSLVLFWANLQTRNARSGLIEPVIFPAYVKILWGVASADLFTFILVLIVETQVNSYDAMLLYCLASALQHTVTEGIAFILMQKGCGEYATKRSKRFAVCWFFISFFASYLVFMEENVARYIGWAVWFLTVVFYGLLWLLPAKSLFRRPAAISYARFWFWYRALMLLFFCFILLRPPGTQSWGYCGALLVGLIGHALCHPLIIYFSLAEDSRWWQGIISHLSSQPDTQDSDPTANPSVTDMRSPLIGVDFSIHIASALAEALDYMGHRRAVNILNFAQIQITSQRRLLGRGSFSKVYRSVNLESDYSYFSSSGMYKGQTCAVKLIFTSDLTEEVISRVTAESTILSSVDSVNVVKILGIAVLPPSVCMVLELCAYGSLSDVLRGSDPHAGGRLPLALNPVDRMFLALGCARGVAALHALSDKIVHRDIKSFNFLVDAQFNAKLADLELGIHSVLPENEHEDAPTVDDFLVNWVAPEVLRGEAFTQGSDIYSLALVLFEIVTGLIPYDDVPVIRTSQRQAIKDLVITGYRPDLRDVHAVPRYLDLIERGWSGTISSRPTADDMVIELQHIWASYISPYCEDISHSRDISNSVDSWISSSSGKDYIKSMTPAIYRHSDRPSIRKSLSTFQGRNSTINSSGQQNSLQNISNIHLSDEFFSIQTIMNTNVDWMKIETSSDPICIISSTAPHLILKSSNPFSSLIDTPSQDLFGQSLYTLSYTNQSELNSEHIQSNKSALEGFYQELTTSHYSHVVLTLFTSNSAPVLCLVHAFPVFYREVIYREYAGLVSVVQESIGTAFSSDYYDYQIPTLPSSLSHPKEKSSSISSVLFYQLHFSVIDFIPPSQSPESSGNPSGLIGNFTRMFSTGSLRASSQQLPRSETSNTLFGSERFLSNSTGREKNRTDSSGRSSIGSQGRRNHSNYSQTTISISSSNEKKPPLPTNSSRTDLDQTEESPMLENEIESEKSFEYDSLEGGVMLERTNTNNSFKSGNSSSGWMNNY